MYAGTYRGDLVTWNGEGEEPEPLHKEPAHDGWIRSAAASPDGKWVATAGNDRRVRIWSADNGTAARTFAGHEDEVYVVGFSPDGQYVVSGDLKGVLRVWDVASGGV